MKTMLPLLVVIVLAGGGYYVYSQQQAPAPAQESTNTNAADMMDDAAMETHDDAAMTDPMPAATGTAPQVTDTGSTGAPSAATAGAVKEFTVTNKGFVYNPKNMTVKKGDRVKITYTNGGGTHDLRIDGYNVGTKVIQAGQSETFEFVADKAGTFEFYCSVGSHRANGMVGTFTVTN